MISDNKKPRNLPQTGPGRCRPEGVDVPEPTGCRECGITEPTFARGLCKKCYPRLQKQGNLERHPLLSGRKPPREWLALIDRSDPGTCWSWPGPLDRNGYGNIRSRGRTTGAHRWVYERQMGVVLEPHQVLDHLCHKTTTCDGGPRCPHRRCVNPLHLVVTNNTANVRRSAGERPKCRNGHLRTVENTAWIRSAKGYGGLRRTCRDCKSLEKKNGRPEKTGIPIDRVFELRDSGWLQREIAKELSISQSYVSELLSGRNQAG